MKAGVARRLINPPLGIILMGYDRSKGNTGVHDDLTATALVLEDGGKKVAIITLDMVGLSDFVVNRIRSCLVPVEAMLCCSHTHSGPIAHADEKSSCLNREYIDFLIEQIGAAVYEAASNTGPVSITYSNGELDLALNRRREMPDGSIKTGPYPKDVVDRSIQVLSVINEDGERVAMLINYACHGTVLGPKNLLASADWIGAMRSKVENQLGGHVLFLQGAAGNINPPSAWGNKPYERLEKIGSKVAEAVIDAVHDDSEEVHDLNLQLEREETWLPTEIEVRTRKYPKAYRKPLIKSINLPGWMSFRTDPILNKLLPYKPRVEARDGFWSVPLRINTLRIGDLALITFSGELFTELGLTIKQNSPARHTLVVSITDGFVAYLPTRRAHAQGGYEIEAAPYLLRFPGRFAANCEDIVLDAAQTALDGLWNAPPS
ncbi:MAG: neutral/alkaline non-lysosomal ceramidase N-terminal domain-containing protein [Candidatus Hodarchaeota archaeon]